MTRLVISLLWWFVDSRAGKFSVPDYLISGLSLARTFCIESLRLTGLPSIRYSFSYTPANFTNENPYSGFESGAQAISLCTQVLCDDLVYRTTLHEPIFRFHAVEGIYFILLDSVFRTIEILIYTINFHFFF